MLFAQKALKRKCYANLCYFPQTIYLSVIFTKLDRVIMAFPKREATYSVSQ